MSVTELPLASVGPGLLQVLAHPLALKTSTTQLDRFLKTWATSWILPLKKSSWLRVITWTGSELCGRAKAVSGCLLTVEQHRGSEAGVWTFNWSLASCWRNNPNVTVTCLTVSLHRAGYSLKLCGKNKNSNPVLILHLAHRGNDKLEKAFCFIWANVLSCLQHPSRW